MKKSIQESFQAAGQKAWSEMRLSFSIFEEEMVRRFRLFKEKTDLHQSSEDIQRVLCEFCKRFQQNSEALEQRLQEMICTVFAKIKAPLMEEISILKSKAEQLSHRIEIQRHRKRETAPHSDHLDEKDGPNDPPTSPKPGTASGHKGN